MITEIDQFNQTLTRYCSIIKSNDKFSSGGVKEGRPVKGRKPDNRRKREIAARMRNEIIDIVKEEFDYEIPFVLFENSAKGRTYGLDEDHLREIAAEYTAYRKQNKLWKPQNIPIALIKEKEKSTKKEEMVSSPPP